MLVKRVHEEMMGSVLGDANMVKTAMDILRILCVSRRWAINFPASDADEETV